MSFSFVMLDLPHPDRLSEHLELDRRLRKQAQADRGHP